ncbi:MAG TPA: dCTP deaminase [Dehalococcoidia bacterium]|nr:dCTP deaminase [Dehalococcoidia bacterium]
MSVLSDRSIREAIESGRLVIDPWDERYLQPASVDLRLGREFRVFRNYRLPYIDPKQEMPNLTDLEVIEGDNPFILHPGEFALAVTVERVEIPDDLVGRLDGKSSLGRLGLIVHSTAGFVDPGFKGRLTLELTNIINLPVALYYNMPVSQISFVELSTPSENPYGSSGSKYQGQSGPEASRYYLNFRQTGELNVENPQSNNQTIKGPPRRRHRPSP